MEKLYRIEEQTTTGWNDIDPNSQPMNQEKTAEKWKDILESGYNPNDIRIVRVQ